MTYLITISSDTEYVDMTVKNRTLDQAKEIARGLWRVVENPLILSIKEMKEDGKFEPRFTYQQK